MKTTAFHVALVVLAALGLASSAPAADAQSISRGSLRVYGDVAASFDGNRVVFRCEDASRADILMGKLLADLFWASGDGKTDTTIALGGQSIVAHEWPPYGAIAIGRIGATVLAVGASDKKALSVVLGKEPMLHAGKFVSIPANPYPQTLDFYDLKAFKFYTEAMNSPDRLGLDSHWPFVRSLGLGGLAYQNLGIADSPAPGVELWAGSDYEVREAQRQHGMVVPSVEVAGAIPFWMRNEFPDAIAQPNPSVLMIGWQMPALSNTYCQSWGSPLDLQNTYCLSFLKQVIDRYASSPAIGGWQFYAGEPGAELGFHDRTTENYDYSPEGQASFRNYLQKVRGYSLAELGKRWFGAPGHYSAWSQVTIPDLHGFFGNLNEDCFRINEGWSWLPKDRNGSDETIPSPASNWISVEMPPSQQQVTLPQPDAYCKVRFDISRWSKSHADKSVYLICDLDIGSDAGARVWLNGNDLGKHKAKDGGQGAFGLDITDLLHSGGNDLVLLIPHEGKIIGPVFLTTTQPAHYPYLGALRNAQFVDATAWQTYSLYFLHDTVFRKARQLDPDRAMGMGSDEFALMAGQIADLCHDYGLSVQNTGREAWYFPWWPGLGCVDDFYYTSESGGTPNEADLTRLLSWILFDGDSSTMLFQNIESFQKLEHQDGWFTRHKNALRLEGKALREKPKIALFRSTTTSLLGEGSPWTWDVGRGELEASHYDNVYVTEREILNGKVNAYPVLFDCGSVYTDPDVVSAIQRYVENGGTFVALQNTGWHTTTQPDSYPISRLTGFDVLSKGGSGPIKFEDNIPVLGLWSGKTFQGSGAAVDYRGANSAGIGLSMQAAVPEAVSLARWQDGSTAVGFRKLGKGRVIVLGSSFWRSGRDIAGVWQSQSELERAFFDRLFTDLNVFRTTGSQSVDVWTRKFVTKNGLQDWLVAINSGPAPVTTSLTMNVERQPVQVWDLTTGDKVAFTYADGKVTIPNVAIVERENRVFAVQRADLVGGIPAWWEEKLRFWKKVSPIGSAVSVASSDVVRPADPAGLDTVAADRWKFTMASSNQAGDSRWKLPGFDDSAWRTIGNGPWNFQYADMAGYAGSADYRLRFNAPASWIGHKVSLGLRAIHVPVVYGHGEFALNGHRVAAYDFSVHDGETYNYDVTDQVKPGENVLSLEITSTGAYGGVGGAVWLAAEPVLTDVQDMISGWNKIGEDRSTIAMVSFPGNVHGRYVYRDVDLPADFSGKNVYLHIETPYQWIGLVMINGHPIYNNSMGTNFGTRLDINLAPFFKAGASNRIGLWPFETEPRYSGNEARQQADMNITAIKIGYEAQRRSE